MQIKAGKTNMDICFSEAEYISGICDETYEHELSGICDLIEARDLETGTHMRRLREITEILLRQMQKEGFTSFNEREIMAMARCSMLHDIGKMGISNTILKKPGPLTSEERAIMQTHCQLGEVMISRMRNDMEVLRDPLYARYARDICLYHHERWDGDGYPYGLKGDEIPIWAHAVALADVFDALTHERVYRNPTTYAGAVQMISAGECGSFSHELLKCFVDLQPRLRLLTAADYINAIA